MEAWLREHKITWPNGYGDETGEAFGIEYYPSTFVVGRDGKIFWSDENEEVGLQEAIEKALSAAENK